MRLALTRRPVALLAAAALLSTGGVASGLFAGTALAAADQPLSPASPASANNDSGATSTLLSFTTTGTPFNMLPAGTTAQLIGTASGAGQVIQNLNAPPATVTNGAITIPFDLRFQAPAVYDVKIIVPPALGGGTETTYVCTSTPAAPCFTLAGFTPTVASFSRTGGDPDPLGTYMLSGTRFAKGAKVSFEQVVNGANVVDSGVALTSPSDPAPNGTTITGGLTVARNGAAAAKAGAHNVVIMNTDGKRGVCTNCLTIPRLDSVSLVGAPTSQALVLGRNVTKDVNVKGDGFTPQAVAKFHQTATYSAPDGITVNSTTFIDPQTLKLNITVADDAAIASGSSSLRDLTVSNPDGGYELYPDALKVTKRPLFSATPLDRVNPGVSSPPGGVDITIDGTGFQTGATLAISPAQGITLNTFEVSSDTQARANLSIAKDAALTARAFTITNPDFGSSAGGSATNQASITPSTAPVVTGVTPTSASSNASAAKTVPFKVLGSGFSKQSLSGTGSNNPNNNSYTQPKIVFLTPNGAVDNNVTATDPQFNAAATEASSTVTIAAGAAPGPRRVAFLDKNLSYVECFTASAGPCFNVDSLAVTGISPNLGTNDTSATVTVTGSGFGVNASPRLERPGQPDILGTLVGTPTSSSLQAAFNLIGAAPGNNAWSIRVTNGDGSTGILNNAYTISGPAPHFTSATPNTVRAGQKAARITIKGTDIARGATLVIGPCPVTVTTCNQPTVVGSRYIDAATSEFTLDTTGATVGARNLQVKNTDGQSTPTNDCGTAPAAPQAPAGTCFTIADPATITSVVPNGRAAGSPATNVVISGTNFSQGATVTFSGSGVTGDVQSIDTATNKITVKVTVASDATPGARDVTVTNPDGSTATSVGGFTVKPTPTVASISPAIVLRGATNVPVTVTGTGFDPAGVSLNLGPDVTVTSPTPSQDGKKVTATVTVKNPASASARGPVDVIVTNTQPANGGVATLTKGFTLADLPGKPTSLAGTRGNSLVNLTWTAPVDNGGQPITSYTVTVTRTTDGTPVTATVLYPGDRSQTGAVVTGLTNGTAYTFAVKATTLAGTGLDGDTKPSVTPATNPGAPTAVTATPKAVSASVAFTAPASNGGSPITKYTATSSPGGFTGTGTTSPITVNGLTAGTSYTFVVVATNAVGDSAPSAASNAVTPTAGPTNAPSALTASATRAPATVDLTWTAPSAPSAPVTSYTVTITPNAGTVTYPSNRAVTGAVVTGLTNGTQYSFTVAANSSAGTSPSSNVATATPYAVPGVVRNLTGSTNNGTATVLWDAPADNGGSPVTKYTLTISPNAGTITYPTDRTQTGATITGLSTSTNYTVKVVAENLRGPGAATTFGPLKELTVPTAPQSPAATAGPSQATVTWTAPTSDGGAPITGYTVTSSPGAITKTVAGDQRTATVTGLTNGTSYTFTVVATNTKGNSPASAATNAVTPTTTVATSPRNVVATAGNASATLTWSPPTSNGGSPVTSYTVAWSPAGGTVAYPSDRTQLSATVTGLTNGVSYVFSVVANNAQGASPPATSNQVTPGAAVQSSTVVGLNPTPGQVRYGTAIALTGRVVRADKSVGIGVVTVFVRADNGALRQLGRVRPRDTGDYVFRTTPSNNGTYTVRYDGDGSNPSATSAARRTLVAVRITVSAPRGSAKSPQVVSGSVAPNKAGRTIVLYRVLSNGSLQRLGSARIASNGNYSFSVKLARGNHTLQVGLGATPGNAAGATRFTASRT